MFIVLRTVYFSFRSVPLIFGSKHKIVRFANLMRLLGRLYNFCAFSATCKSIIDRPIFLQSIRQKSKMTEPYAHASVQCDFRSREESMFVTKQCYSEPESDGEFDGASATAAPANDKTVEEPVNKRKRLMRFTDELDKLILRQIAAVNPYEDSSRWVDILQVIVLETAQPLTIKNMQARVNLLLGQHKASDDKEIISSGQEPPTPSEKHILLDQVYALKVSYTALKKKSGKTVERALTALGANDREAAAQNYWSYKRKKLRLLGDDTSTSQTCSQDQTSFINQEMGAIAEEQENVACDVASSLEDAEGEQVGLEATAMRDLTNLIDEIGTVLKEEPSEIVGGFSVSDTQQSPPQPQQTGQTSSTQPTSPVEELTASIPRKSCPVGTSNSAAVGPIRRKRGTLTRSITQYMKDKRSSEKDLKAKELEIALLREQNESRRIALQEQAIHHQQALMNAQITCCKELAEIVKQLLRERSSQ